MRTTTTPTFTAVLYAFVSAALVLYGCAQDQAATTPAADAAGADTNAADTLIHDDDGHTHDGDEHGTDAEKQGHDGDEHGDGGHHDAAMHDGEHHGDGAQHGDGESHGDGDEHSEDGHGHGTGTLSSHIHMLDFWGPKNEEVAFGTHIGAYRTQAGSKQLVELGGKADFMGFVRDPANPDTYWGSGHNPAAGLGLWGFVESTDGGKTWKVKSLSGSADFHQMDASVAAKGVVGGTFASKLWVSTDSGAAWKSYAWAKAATGVLFESATSVLLASQADGIERVTVPAMTAKSLTKDAISGMCRHGAGIMYGTSDGKLHVCDADAASCATIAGPPGKVTLQCLVDAAKTARMYVLVSGSVVYHSDDAGKTWELIANGQ